MTIQDTTRKAGPFNGNGSLTNLPFAFKTLNATYIAVTKLDTTNDVEYDLTYSVDYTVTLNANQDTNPGGYVTLLVPLAVGYTAAVISDAPYDQATEFPDLSVFYPRVVERTFDRTEIQIQQLREIIGRAVLQSAASPVTFLRFPSPSANKFIQWNSAGTGLENQFISPYLLDFPEPDADKWIGWNANETQLVNKSVEGLPQIVGQITGAYLLANISALRVQGVGFAPTMVYVAGYSTVTTTSTPDGGEGFFVYDASDVSSADNTGTIIVDAAGRRWKRSFNGAVNVKWFGATGVGGEYTAAFENAGAYCSANKLGLYVPAGRYGVTNLTPYPNVDMFGDGDQSVLFLVENPLNNAVLFYDPGLDRATYYLRVWKALNNVAIGNTVTLTTPADAAGFAVGDLVVVASTGYLSSGGNDRQPYYALINKIVGINGGVLTLESPIFDAITGAQIAKQNAFTTPPPVPDKWCQHSTFRNLCLDLSTRPAGVFTQAFFVHGMYRCEISDILMIGTPATHAVNGFCYSVMRNIRSVNMLPGGNVMRALEVKTGSYECYFENIFCDSGATYTANQPVVEIGEYAHRVYIDGVEFNAPNLTVTSTYLVGPSGSMGSHYHFKNITARVADCVSFVSSNLPASSGLPSYSDHLFENVTIDSPSCDFVVRLVGNTLGTAQVVFDGVRSVRDPAFYAIYIADLYGFVRSAVRRLEANAVALWVTTSPLATYGTPDIEFTDWKVKNWGHALGYNNALYAQPWEVGFTNIRRFGDAALRKAGKSETTRLTVATASGDTTFYSGAFPAWGAFPWSYGDAIEFDIEGEFIGATTTKTITLKETTTNTTLALYTGTGAGVFTIKGRVGWYGASDVSGAVVTNFNGVLPSVKNGYMTPANLAFSLVANMSAAGDFIGVYRCRIIPRLSYADGFAP